MNTNEELYVHTLSDLGALQRPACLRYGLCCGSAPGLAWGVWVRRTGHAPDEAAAPGLCAGRRAACALARFLYENCVEPAALAGLTEDLRAAGVLHRLDAQFCQGE